MGPEKIFERRVRAYIEHSGGWQVKYFANRMTKAGIPDILACIGGYFVAIEVKSDTGSPSDLQLQKIREIRKAGGFAFVLYPSGWKKFCDFIQDLTHEAWSLDMDIEFK